MTASRLRIVLAVIGLVGGLGSLGALVMAVKPAPARQQALANVSELRLQSASPKPKAEIEKAQAAVSSVLAWSPTDSELWVVQGRLAASLRATDQRIADVLKMSYLTAPGNFALMPGRLDVAMTTKALSDPMLEVLAEGDVRAILLKRPDLANGLVDSYQRATEPGKAFLARAAAASNPAFAARLAASRR
jgi:hypothetical protein